MSVSSKVLQDEKVALKKSFDDLQQKIQVVEKEISIMRNNLNAIHGAMQQTDKLIKLDQEASANVSTSASTSNLQIAEKEEAKLLNESEK